MSEGTPHSKSSKVPLPFQNWQPRACSGSCAPPLAADYTCIYPQTSTAPIKAKSYPRAEEPASLGQVGDYKSERRKGKGASL